MAHLNTNSLLSILPNEILLKIFSQIDFGSLFAVCEVCDLDHFLHEKRLIGILDLQRQYSCNLETVGQRIGCELVTCLNINNVYWIEAPVLRKFIGQLKNLEKLYAMGTKLSVESEDMELYNRLQIKVLGISYSGLFVDHEIETVPSVRSLYLQMFGDFHIKDVFPGIKKIWVDYEWERNFYYIEFDLAEVPKFIVQAKDVPALNAEYGFYYTDFDSVEFINGTHPLSITCKDDVPLKRITLDEKNPMWLPLLSVSRTVPIGPRDFWKLLHNETLETIKLYELFLTYEESHCLTHRQISYRTLLGLTCCSNLKKLHVKSCVLTDEDVPTSQHIDFENIKILVPLDLVYTNLQNLEVLEIVICPNPNHKMTPTLSFIKTIKNLKHLNLEVPSDVPEGFLEQIFQNCIFLEVVKLRPQTPNKKLNDDICRAIPFARNLRDFFFQKTNIPISKLLRSFSQLSSNKIQRLALVCDEYKGISTALLRKFIDANPQLVFLYFEIKSIQPIAFNNIHNILQGYTDRSPGKIFVISKIFKACLVPFVHFDDLLDNNTTTMKLQACNEFENF